MSGTGYSPPADHPIFVNGVAINTSGGGSHGAVGVRVRNIRGWLGEGVEVRDTREAKAGRDGEYADTQCLAGRTVTFEGTVTGSTYANLQSRKLSLAAAWNSIASVEAVVKLPKPEAAAPSFTHADAMTDFERVEARLTGGGIVFGQRFGLWGQRWQVSIRASDPRIYSDVATSTDSITTGTATRTVTVDQAGTYPTPPTLTVTGPTSSDWTVSDTAASGLALPFVALSLAATETVTMSPQERTVDLTGTYERVRLLRSITALWMLDEAAGVIADNEQGTAAYDGTYTGGYTLNQPGPAAGIASVDLNGTTAYVAIPYSAALNPAKWTWEAWCLIDTLAGDQTIVDSLSGGTTRGFGLFVSSAGAIWCQIGDGVGSVLTTKVTSGGRVRDGVWHHIAVTHDGATITAYVDGASPQSKAATYSPNATVAMRLGAKLDGTQFLNGRLAAVALYPSALSAAEIADLYEARADTASLPGYAYLDAAGSRWAEMGAGSHVFALASAGLAAGSKLNVTYRDARV